MASLDQVIWSSYWFSLELKRDAWPWIYEKSEKPSLIICGGARSSFQLTSVFRLTVGESPTWTDNRANGSTVNKLMTPKFPASAVWEMAVQLKKRSLQASIQWTPRTANREADSLANGNAQNFNPDYECVICPDSFEWLVLPQALERGREAEDEFRVFRESGRVHNVEGNRQKGK